MTASKKDSSDSGSEDVIVIGDDPVGIEVVSNLKRVKRAVFVGEDGQIVNRLEGYADVAKRVDSENSLDYTAGSDISSAVVATSSDSRNLLFAQRLRIDAGIEDIVVRINHPQHTEAFASLSVETVGVSEVVGSALVEYFELCE